MTVIPDLDTFLENWTVPAVLDGPTMTIEEAVTTFAVAGLHARFIPSTNKPFIDVSKLDSLDSQWMAITVAQSGVVAAKEVEVVLLALTSVGK